MREHDDKTTAGAYVAQLLNLPDNLELECIVAVGYPAETKPAYAESDLLFDRGQLQQIRPKQSIGHPMIIDIHTHIFPKAVRDRRESFFDGEPPFETLYGSPKSRLISADELVAKMDESAGRPIRHLRLSLAHGRTQPKKQRLCH